MSKFKFNLKEESRIDKIYLVAEFAGGDADTEHPEETKLEFPFSDLEKESSLHIIDTEIEQYKILKGLLDGFRRDRLDYDEILKEYGEDIASLYDNTPNDPQNDYQDKCYLDRVILRAYDENGNMYETYDLL
jgi:hypothetical protein